MMAALEIQSSRFYSLGRERHPLALSDGHVFEILIANRAP